MRNPIFLLKQAYIATHRSLDRDLEPHGLTAAQLDVLMILWATDGIEHRALQEELGVASPTLTNILDGMVERNFVERRVSPNDSRVKEVYLTPRGIAMSSELAEASDQFVAKMLVGFSPSETALFCDWLERVSANLNSPNSPA